MTEYLKQIFYRPKLAKPKIVFLDRDGTIIVERHHLHTTNQVKLYRSAIKGIKLLNRFGYLAIVVTNQSAVARGLITLTQLEEINKYIFERFNKFGAKMSAFYSCPHHPNANLPQFRKVCKCRKPAPAMYKSALADFQAVLKDAVIVGDMTTDVQAGENLGIKTFLVNTGHKGKDGRFSVTPDYKVKNLLEAAKTITNSKD